MLFVDTRVVRSENKTSWIQMKSQGLSSPGWAVFERPRLICLKEDRSHGKQE